MPEMDRELLDRDAIAAMARGEKGMPQQESVGTSMERLHTELESLHVLLSRLEDSLCAILKPADSPDRLEPTAYATMNASSLRDSIDSAALKLVEAMRRVDSLLTRIDV